MDAAGQEPGQGSLRRRWSMTSDIANAQPVFAGFDTRPRGTENSLGPREGLRFEQSLETRCRDAVLATRGFALRRLRREARPGRPYRRNRKRDPPLAHTR